jgi:hypothetical protein
VIEIDKQKGQVVFTKSGIIGLPRREKFAAVGHTGLNKQQER